MDTELQQAKRTAKRITEWGADTIALFGDVATLARAFLAQQEQVAALEAERDEWKRIAEQRYNDFSTMSDVARHAESRLASARVEGAREALTRYGETGPEDGWFRRDAYRFRDRKYPAPAAPAGEQTRRDVEQAYGALADTLARMPEPTITRPAPTPEPEECARPPLRVIAGWESTDKDADGDDRVWYIAMCEDGSVWARQTFLTNDQPWQRQAPSIVALGSRPTQTAEG